MKIIKEYVNKGWEKYNFYFRYYINEKKETFFISEYDFSKNPELLHKELPLGEGYAIGTFLTITSRVLNDILRMREYEIEFGNTKKPIDLIRETLDRYFPDTEEVEDPMDALYVYLLIKLLDEDGASWMDSEIGKIEKLIDFIDVCTFNTRNCNKPLFDSYLAYSKEIVPQGEKFGYEIFMSSKTYEGDMNDLFQALKEGMNAKSLMKEMYEKHGKSLRTSGLYQTSIFYKLKTVHEFLLILLQILFDERKVIKACEYCHSYFVPLKRSDEKYCSFPNSVNKSRNCKAQVKLNRQLAVDRSSDSKIIHKRIRTKLSTRINKIETTDNNGYDYGNHERKIKTLDTFLEESQNLRRYFREKKYSYFEEDYINWMNDFYAKRNIIDIEGYNQDTIRVFMRNYIKTCKKTTSEQEN